MAHFKFKQRVDLAAMKTGDVLPTSDFAEVIPGTGELVQFEYVEQEDDAKTEVTPGIFSIQKTGLGLKLNPTSFTQSTILSEFVHTETVVNQVKKFYSKIDVYKKYRQNETPKRGWLLYGGAGGGKSTIIKTVCEDLNKEGGIFIVTWPTDKVDSYEVKEFFKTFSYKNVSKQLLIVEDIGGVEIDQVRMKSDSSLLSLLDNVEKTFSVPTAIIATTNHPEIFLGNLTNRPQRFDTKIEIPPPDGTQRSKFLEFFSNNEATEDVLKEIKDKRYDALTPAHIKEIVIRCHLEDISLSQSLKLIQQEVETYKNNFEKRKGGLGL